MNRKSLTSEDIANLFNSNSHRYTTDTLLPQLTATGIVDRLEIMQIAPKRIVDLGCGCGQLTHLLTERYPQAAVISIDLARKMLRQATKHCDMLIQADAIQPPLANHSIDLIVANLSFPWNPLDKLLHACHQLLATNGLLFFTTFGPDLLKTLRRDYCRQQLIDMHDIGDQLIKSGFSDPVMECEYQQFRYTSRDKFEREFTALGLSTLVTLDPMKINTEKFDATFEIIYGHCWEKMSASADEDGVISIPLSKIGHRR